MFATEVTIISRLSTHTALQVQLSYPPLGFRKTTPLFALPYPRADILCCGYKCRREQISRPGPILSKMMPFRWRDNLDRCHIHLNMHREGLLRSVRSRPSCCLVCLFGAGGWLPQFKRECVARRSNCFRGSMCYPVERGFKQT